MAILLIKIEDTASLALNEFFDFNGHCYALAGSRSGEASEAFRMEEFYEATRDTERLEEIPVFFVSGEGADSRILGWYKRAEVTRKLQVPSLFLQGNVRADAGDVILLPEKDRSVTLEMQAPGRLWEVAEEEDMRFDLLQKLLKKDPEENAFLRYAKAAVRLEPKLLKQPEACLNYCGQLAEVLLNDQCRDLSEIKLLEAYAAKMKEKQPKNPDGYYYHALACCHLGFFREGMKSVRKALELEPEAADLRALKGMLLAEKGYYGDSAACLHEAFEISQEEEYLLLEGRVYSMAGQMNKAYECFAAIQNQELLDNAGIQLSEMEKRWSFADLLSFRRKNRGKGKAGRRL